MMPNMDETTTEIVARMKTEFMRHGYTRAGHVEGDTWYKTRDFLFFYNDGYLGIVIYDKRVVATYSWIEGKGYLVNEDTITATEFINKLLAEL